MKISLNQSVNPLQGDAVELRRGALYHHIKSKEDVLYDISRQYIADLVNYGNEVLKTESDPKKRLETRPSFNGDDSNLSNQSELTVCFREIYSLTGPRWEEVLVLHGEYEHIWRQVLIDGEKQGVFRPFNPARLKGLLGMFFYSYLWMDPNGPQGPEKIAEVFNDIV